MYHIGVIGCGGRMSGLVVNHLANYPELEITAVCDLDIPKVKERLSKKYDVETIHYYLDAEEMMQKEKLDAVLVGTRCSLHTKMALIVGKYNIPLFLEKPVSTTEEDLERLKTLLPMNEKVVVSFPLRLSPIVTEVKKIVDSGELGEITHVQAYNNVPYGRGYYHKWYRDDHETGGLWLQKATHDFDYINHILGEVQPTQICAMSSKQVFKGDMPAGLTCDKCDRQDTCCESKKNVTSYNDPYVIGDYCCFAVDTGNQDSGSAILRYSNGMHAVYSQNFVARKGAQKRGARFIGYYGTVEFDFYTGVAKVYWHTQEKVTTIELGSSAGHAGGDEKLIQNFVDVIKGIDVSHSTLAQGIDSARICLMARKSSQESIFCDI